MSTHLVRDGWGATLSVSCNDCEPTRHDCKPRIKSVGSGARNVGREHALESMIVGQDGRSIASRALFHCEPLQLRRRVAWHAAKTVRGY
jgi:hypothetical protein